MPMTADTADLTVTEALESDLQWVLALENDAVKDGFVSGDPEVRHRLQMSDRTAQYLIAKRGEERIGYVILRGLLGQEPVVELKRIVVGPKDAGLGQALMRLVMRYVFGELGAHRLWLDVLDDNMRAQHVYRKLGFFEEGRFREAALRQGEWRDLLIFGLLRSEYEAVPRD